MNRYNYDWKRYVLITLGTLDTIPFISFGVEIESSHVSSPGNTTCNNCDVRQLLTNLDLQLKGFL